MKTMWNTLVFILVMIQVITVISEVPISNFNDEAIFVKEGELRLATDTADLIFEIDLGQFKNRTRALCQAAQGIIKVKGDLRGLIRTLSLIHI